MKSEFVMEDSQEIILKVFKRVNDMVVPSMGPKSMYAVIDDPMGQPIITDDGVTIAKSIANMKDPYHKMIAKSIIEAAHNTEKEAYDGTTLTVLLTYEIFKLGQEMIKLGEHPQQVSDNLKHLFDQVLTDIEVFDMEPHHVQQLAAISTKMPLLGEVVAEAYKISGKGMEVFIEHKPNNSQRIQLNHTKGLSLRSGYGLQQLQGLIRSAPKAKLALLKEGNLSQLQLQEFFGSIPKDEKHVPIVYVTGRQMNPEVLRIVIETSTKQNLPFQFIFIEEALEEEIFLDLAAISGGRVKDYRSGVKNYTWQICGTVNDITIDKDKSSMIGTTQSEQRIEYYEELLKDEDRKLDNMHRFHLENRLASLKNGVVKIEIGSPTQLEYNTIRLKLDDAIGAVRKGFEQGITLGGGKALYNLAGTQKYTLITNILQAPHKRILKNAGLEERKYRTKKEGVDVLHDKVVDLFQAGIIDSYASISQSIKNATSIATNFLRAYALIKEEGN